MISLHNTWRPKKSLATESLHEDYEIQEIACRNLISAKSAD